MKLSRDFYLREDTLQIARELLGKLLVVAAENGNRISGMIVEVEAYMGVMDKAAHTYGGRRTPRNEITYAVGGSVYVFFVYGMYHQFNVVTGPAGYPHVVLIRALQPVEEIETMRMRRGPMQDKNLTSGPGKLCIAMDINRGFNGEDLLGEKIWMEDFKKFSEEEVAVGKRIGIDYAAEDAERPWRFWINGNPHVSKTGRKK